METCELQIVLTRVSAHWVHDVSAILKLDIVAAYSFHVDLIFVVEVEQNCIRVQSQNPPKQSYKEILLGNVGNLLAQGVQAQVRTDDRNPISGKEMTKIRLL